MLAPQATYDLYESISILSFSHDTSVGESLIAMMNMRRGNRNIIINELPTLYGRFGFHSTNMRDINCGTDYPCAEPEAKTVVLRPFYRRILQSSSGNTENSKNDMGEFGKTRRMKYTASRKVCFNTPLILIAMLGFMLQTSVVLGSSGRNVLDADELLIGHWNLKLQGMFGFDLSQLFPISTSECGNAHDADDDIISTQNRETDSLPLHKSTITRTKRHRHGLFSSSLFQRINNGSGPMDCHLSIHSDGTFTILPTTKPVIQAQLEGSTTTGPTTTYRTTDSIMPIRGQWHVLANPYCVTDRAYDQVVLESYPRIRKRRLKHPNNKNSKRSSSTTTTTNIDGSSDEDDAEEQEVIKLSFNCRMQGRYNRINGGLFGLFRPNYSHGRITHGTLVWGRSSSVGGAGASEDDAVKIDHPSNSFSLKSLPWKRQHQRRSIVASFKGLRPVKFHPLNQHNVTYESEDAFGY